MHKADEAFLLALSLAAKQTMVTMKAVDNGQIIQNDWNVDFVINFSRLQFVDDIIIMTAGKEAENFCPVSTALK